MSDTPQTEAEAQGVVRFPAPVIIAALCIGSFACALMQSLIIPIQGELPRLLDTSAGNASWAVTATLLAGAVMMPVTGRLADMYGKKVMLCVSVGFLLVGSLCAAIAPSLVPFIIGRALQGAAMGYIPVAISMVREVAPVDKQAFSVSVVSATMGVGGAIGLPLAAWIAQTWDWHFLFWVSAGMAVLVLVLTVVVVPHVRDEHPARLDVIGVIGLAVGMVAFLVGVSKGSEWGWTSATTIGAILGGIAVLLVWGRYQLGHHDPLVDLRNTARRPVLFTNLAAVAVGFGLLAQAIVVPQLLILPQATGHGMGQTLLAAGLWMAPSGLMMMCFAPVSSWLIRTRGARFTLALAGIVLACGYAVASVLMRSPLEMMIASMVISAGVGIGYAAMPTLIMDHTPIEEASSAVGINGLMRSIGTTSAGAAMAAILTTYSVEMVPGQTPIPTETAFHLCFLVGGVAALIGTALALCIPKVRR